MDAHVFQAGAMMNVAPSMILLTGTAEAIKREAADIQLMKCAADKGYPNTGILLRFGASVGGVSWLPTPFRWGFGWKYPQSGPVK